MDGRNGESSSESVNSYYALRLLGMAIGNNDMKNFGSMLLATEIQAVKNYWHMPSSSKIYEDVFKNNKMVGMVWSQKVDHLTWFGTDDIYVHGINMLPFTPITEILLDYPFVSEQYPVLASKGVRDETWTCYAVCDQAIIDKAGAWSRALTV
jgi:endo-1,3(4)-beta-glucanase